MASSAVASGSTQDDDLAARLLFDINVKLNIDAPSEKHVLFESFLPQYYKTFRHHDLPQALVEAYKLVTDSVVKENLRRIVWEALLRCVQIPLGVERSLIVMELAFGIAEEKFSSDLWRKLFLRYENTPEMPRWIGSLLLQWSSWGVRFEFDKHQAKLILNKVQPDYFECALEYLFGAEANGRFTGNVLRYLGQVAHQRLQEQSPQFENYEIDTEALEERASKLCKSPPPESSDTDRRVKDHLSGKWGSSDPGFYRRQTSTDQAGVEA